MPEKPDRRRKKSSTKKKPSFCKPQNGCRPGQKIHRAKKQKTGHRNQQKNCVATNAGNLETDIALPMALLSLDEYYAEYGFEKKDGVFVASGSNVQTFEELYGLALEEGAKVIRNEKQYSTILPPVFLELLLEARKKQSKGITRLILEASPELSSFRRRMSTAIQNFDDAVYKFRMFLNLLLVEEILQCDIPLISNVKMEVYDEGKRVKKEKKKGAAAKDPDDAKTQSYAIVKVKVPASGKSTVDQIRPLMTLYAIDGFDSLKDPLSLIVADVTQEDKHSVVSLMVAGDKNLLQLNLFKDVKVSMFSLPNISAFVSTQSCFSFIRKSQSLVRKIFPVGRSNPAEVALYRYSMQENMDSLDDAGDIKFNEKQKEAIYAITRPTAATFILFGPPGTGKTYTLVESIRQLYVKNPKQKYLICTPSNMAADAISLAILQRKFVKVNDVIRLVASSQDAVVRNRKLDCITNLKQLKGPDGQVIRPYYDLPESKKLNTARIVICTLGSTIRLHKSGISPGHFSHIFIDEAAQSAEMESWLPIGFLATPDTRIVLAGDPLQLGPVTTCQCMSGTCFKISMLARLSQHPVYVNDERYMVQLVENHRSHAEIVKIFSDLFYASSLVPTSPKGCNSLCNVSILPKKNFPILFHSVKLGTEKCSETKSIKNEKEIELVLKYVCIVRDKFKVDEKDIGVIAPYTFQGDVIRSRLRKNSEVVVGSVEKFQGSEKRVIIFSTVRTGKELGFMRDELRFNTAISRAKHLLIIIGNEKTFSQHKMWKGFIDTCKLNNSFITSKSVLEKHC